MLRVLHLGKFYPPDTGGIESVTATLAKGAARAGHAVSVLCFAEHARGDAQDQGVHICRVPQTMKMSSQPLGWRYLWRGWTLGRQADLVHVHTPNMLAALLAVCMPRQVKVVVHWHSDVVGKGRLARMLAPLEAKLLRRADQIICTSVAYAEASATVKPFAGKVAVVPIGVPDLRQRHRDVHGEQSVTLTGGLAEHVAGRPVVLCIGRLVPYKGYSTLVEAAKLMTTEAALVVVGGGPLAESLQAHIDGLGVGQRLLLTGRVDDATMAGLLQRATVFCMPSVERSEAFGVALVEAMTWQLPLVATQISGSGVPWVNIHEESGLNVAPGDPVALARALDQLLTDDTLRRRLAAGARRRYEALFTEQKSVDATLAVYQQASAQD